METQTHGEPPELLTHSEALARAWDQVHEHGWRMRVTGWRGADGRWHYRAGRGGRKRARP